MSPAFTNRGLQYLKVAIAIVSLVLFVSVIVGGVGSLRSTDDARSARQREWLKGEGAFFVRKNCISCHSISSVGIRAGNVGPDLSEAVVDTQRRFGKSLEEFLERPSGTMSIVLSTRIPLTEAEKQEAIQSLRIAYQRKLEQKSQLK